MKTLLIALSFLIITGGCGAEKKEPIKSQATSGLPAHTNESNSNGGIVANRMEPTLTIKQLNQKIHFTFKVKNQTEYPVTYHFNSSKTFDYIIKDSNGRVIKQYSKERMFAMHTSMVTVKQGECLTYTDTREDLDKGQYEVTFWLTANEEQPKVTKSFTVN